MEWSEHGGGRRPLEHSMNIACRQHGRREPSGEGITSIRR